MKTIKTFLALIAFMAFSILMYAQGGCIDWKYYYADIANNGQTTVYEVNLNGNFADLTSVVVSNDEVHIAFSESTKLLYLVRKSDGAISIVDPQAGPPTMGPWNIVAPAVPGVVTATIDQNGDLIIGSESSDIIFSVDLVTFIATPYDTYSPIRGGDLEFDSAWDLYLAAGRELYLNQIDPVLDVQIGILDNSHLSTGLALMDNGNLISSYRGLNKLKTHSTAAVSGPTYNLRLSGNPFTANYGDMTSGCISPPPVIDSCSVFSTFYVNHGPGVFYSPGVPGSDLYRVTFNEITSTANLTLLAKVDFEAHIAYDGVNDIVYLVDKIGGQMVEYDVTPNILQPAVAIAPGLSQITAVVFDNSTNHLLVGSGNQNQIFDLDLTGAHVPYANAPVSGGDLAIKNNVLYLDSRTGNKLYSYVGGVFVQKGNIANRVTGLADVNKPTGLIMSNFGSTDFTLINEANGNTIKTYAAELGGSSFTLLNGDMASGCTTGEVVEECPNFGYYYIADNHPGIPNGNIYKGTISGNDFVLTYFFNAGMNGHIAVNDGNGEIYVIEDKGTNIKTFDATGALIRTKPLSGLNHTTTLVWHNGNLYTGDQKLKKVYIIDPVTGGKVLFASNLPVSGGDLISTNTAPSKLLLVERGNAASQVYDITSTVAVPLFNAAKAINGAALMNPGGYIMSEGNNSLNFHTYDAAGVPGPVLNSVDAGLNPFPLFDGDMTSGCVQIPGPPAMKAYTVKTEALPEGELTVFPNPSSGQSSVIFTSSVTGYSTVEVFDMSGRKIATLFNGEVKEGEELRREFSDSSLPNGIYIMVLTNNRESVKTKFSIAR